MHCPVHAEEMKKRKQDSVGNNRIHLHQTENEVTQFQKEEKVQEKKLPYLAILVFVWVGLFFLSIFFVVAYKQWDFSIAWEIKYASYNIENFYNFVTGAGSADGMDARFYQYLIIAITGAGLSACGATFQGSFRNVLAGPSTMGVMSGGTLGCLIYLLLFVPSTVESIVTTADLERYASQTIWERYRLQFFILIGCFAAVVLVLGVATAAGKGKVSAPAMILAGTVLSTVVSNITMVVQYYMILKNPDDPRIETLREMMLGDFSSIGNLQILYMMAIPIGICLIILLCVSGRLNLLSFGEEEARTMGVNVYLYRNLMILVGTVITAVVVAFVGRVGFLGFMVPQVSRKIAGPDMRKLLPTSMLTGAILLTVIFDFAYFIGMADSINMITSSAGCVLMVVILIRKGGGKRAADKRTALPDMEKR